MEDYQKLSKENIEVWLPYIRFKNGKGPSLTTFIYVSNLGNVKGYLYNNRPFTKEMIKINGDGRRCVGCKSIYRFVWELFVDVVPEGFVIHHTDFNKLNDRLDNLVCISKAEHNTIHWKGKHTKGSEIMNQKNKGSVWYNNGNKNKRFKLETEAFASGYFNKGILKGPRKGKKHAEEAKKGCTVSDKVRQAVSRANKGSVWYNNGNKDKRFKSEIEAFVFGYFNKGRLCSPNKGRKFSEAVRKNKT